MLLQGGGASALKIEHKWVVPVYLSQATLHIWFAADAIFV